MTLESFFTPYQCHSVLPGKSVLVLAPHPDDEVFGCGAALAQMAAAGAEIRVLILTDGVLSGEWSELPAEVAQVKRRAKVELRRQESIEAAEVLGYGHPIFLGWQDGELLQRRSMCAELQSQIQGFKPDLLLAPSIWEMHRDHRAVAQLALECLAGAEDDCQLAFYEVGVPLVANYLVDITASLPRKDRAMQCFVSQLEAQCYGDQIRGLNCFRSYTLGSDVASAEAFHLLAKGGVARFVAEHRPDHHSLALLRAEQALQDSAPQLMEVRQQLDMLQRSLSWRITAPLRALRARLRRYFS